MVSKYAENNNKQEALAAIAINGYILMGVSSVLQNDKEVVLAAVSKYVYCSPLVQITY